MMVHLMPAHIQRFTRLWIELAAVGNPAPVASELLARWSEPRRHYHTIAHLDHCLAGLDRHATLAEDVAVVEAALWFHDAVYDPRANDNELLSAALARNVFTRANVSPHRIDLIEQLILGTRTHESDGSPDNALLLDLDLAVLGSEPDAYARYAGAIRLEYDWVPESTYRQKRAGVLDRFLKRPALYLTKPFHRLYESRARQNIADEIARLLPPGNRTPAL